MKLNFKNIGMIKKGDIDIDGITVIAGENDTGKSTVSKLVYSIVKSSDKSDVKQFSKRLKSRKIKKALDKIIITAREKSEHEEDNDFILSRIMSDNLVDNLTKKYIDANNIDITEIENSIRDHFQNNKVELNEDLLQNIINEVLNILKEKKDDTNICRTKFINYIKSLFKGDLCNKYTEKKCEIEVKEGSVKLLNIVIAANELKEYNLFDELYLQDATFVESPIILQLSNLIYNARTTLEQVANYNFIFDRQLVDIQMKDLISKLRQPDNLNYIDKSYHPINEIINGDMSFDENENGFLFKKDIKSFDISNTASGIKSFGVLQMLLHKGFLGERNLLILDEPEVNVHPKWQIEYAILLVELVENFGFRVLVTSHSPYFIEAIKIYGDKSEIKEDINFYKSVKNNDNTVNILPIKDSLQKIFDELTEPLEKLELDERNI
jgi:predicted ATPase